MSYHYEEARRNLFMPQTDLLLKGREARQSSQAQQPLAEGKRPSRINQLAGRKFQRPPEHRLSLPVLHIEDLPGILKTRQVRSQRGVIKVLLHQ